MTYSASFQVDTDPGQTGNHSFSNVQWEIPSIVQLGFPGGSLSMAADQIPSIAEGFAAAFQASIRENPSFPNATVVLTSVVDTEMVEQDTTLYPPTGG
jgi:hypothetical protein